MTLPESALYARVCELLAQDQRFMVCRVVRAVGSAPRNAGAQMLVFEDGAIEFTLGGGAVEGRVIREAAFGLNRNASFVKDYHLGDLGMHCGGIMEVQFDPVSVNHIAFYQKASELIAQRQSFVALYDVQNANRKAIQSSKGVNFGDSSLLKWLEQTSEQNGHLTAHSFIEDNVFVQQVFPPQRLLVFGAGHVGAKLAEVAASTGVFQVDIVDDREAFANAEKLPFCDRVTVAPHNYKGHLPTTDSRTFVAVITRCHDTDKEVLKTLLCSANPLAYLGMIGSVPKRAQLFKFLKDEGLSQPQLDLITTPMGLPIGGKTPGEIAISMLAEIIQRKNELDDMLGGGVVRWKNTQTNT